MLLYIALASAGDFALPPEYGVERRMPDFVCSGWGSRMVDPDVAELTNRENRRKELLMEEYERELFGVGRATIAELEYTRWKGKPGCAHDSSRMRYRETLKQQLAEAQALRREGVPLQSLAGEPRYDILDEREMPEGCDKLLNGRCVNLRGRSGVDGQEVWMQGPGKVYSYEENKDARTEVVSPATVIHAVHHRGLRVNPDIIDEYYTPDDHFNHRYGRRVHGHRR